MPRLHVPSKDALKIERVAILVWTSLMVIAVSRSPYIFFRGRFWAEEGSIFFHHMVAADFPQNLAFVYERGGYYYLFANVATLLASAVPLELAPLVTAWLSLSVFGVLLYLVVFGPLPVTVPAARYVAAALLLLGTSADPEVWANSINAQVYLGLITFVILLFDSRRYSSRWRRLSPLALLFAGLSGLYSAILAPAFAYKWLRTREKADGAASLALGLAGFIQFLVVFHSRRTGELVETKLTVGSAEEVALSTGGFHIAPLLFGRIRGVAALRLAEEGQWRGAILIGLAYVLVGAVLWLVLGSGRFRYLAPCVIASLVLTEVLVHVGSHGQPGGRYAVMPLGILSLVVALGWEFRASDTAAQSIRAVVSILATGAILGSGLPDFWSQRSDNLSCQACPDWAEEVSQWRADPEGQLQIWPYPRWPMKLPAP